jgi:acyl-coenzyme A synthetase/AMP-(fatty) acid ligase
MGWVAERVARYKKVRAVEFIAEIPESPSGKILRRQLRRARRRTPGDRPDTLREQGEQGLD